MATIFEKVDFSKEQCPVYTSYELSYAIKEKRRQDGISLEKFAEKYEIEVALLEKIESAKQLFTYEMYLACSKILDLSIEDITKIESVGIESASFRTSENDEEVKNVAELVNRLFYEIIMQKKIGKR